MSISNTKLKELIKKLRVTEQDSKTRFCNVIEYLGCRVLINEQLQDMHIDILLPDLRFVVEIDKTGCDRVLGSHRKTKKVAHLEKYGFRVFWLTHSQLEDTFCCVSRFRGMLELNKETLTAKASKPSQNLIDNPEWNEAVCQKLGVNTRPKPKRIVLDLKK
jgi:very-short-patch-repair endonuclease